MASAASVNVITPITKLPIKSTTETATCIRKIFVLETKPYFFRSPTKQFILQSADANTITIPIRKDIPKKVNMAKFET